ncbi:MAG: tetratricopeptide repeat protein [Deltaproteobacteria bacterium]|nr:tetratricopeptide repeat protein [Deltaproteobacteria bacterium]MBI3756025.1 tetratricopeptide repeat protein [Deltaproteobacteria bacterium]
MKWITAIFTAMVVFSAGFSGLNAQEAGKAEGKEPQKAAAATSGIQDWMASFWSKIAKIGKKGHSNIPTSVAGLRGAEQEKSKELTPYWKGKGESKDGAAMAAVESLINKKDFGGAVEILESFGQTYPDSPLKPIAVLSLAYCYAQTGKSDNARQVFEAFIMDYPDHELAADAKAGLELLKKKNK